MILSNATSSMIRANLYMEYGGEVPIVKQNVTMEFSASTATATLGQNFSAPTLTTTPSGLAVTYTSSDEAVATVDESTGAVTHTAKGTTTITATFAGNDYYNPGSASYTLTVQGPTMATNHYELVTDADISCRILIGVGIITVKIDLLQDRILCSGIYDQIQIIGRCIVIQGIQSVRIGEMGAGGTDGPGPDKKLISSSVA